MFSSKVNDNYYNYYVHLIYIYNNYIHILGEVGRKRCAGNETLGANPSILDVEDYTPSKKGINYYN